MEATLDLGTLAGLFARSFSLWWAIVPGIALGLAVGVLPGFSPQNTLIILLPVTLAMDVEAALAFMIALYCANPLSGSIPAILVNIPGSAGARSQPWKASQPSARSESSCDCCSTPSAIV